MDQHDISVLIHSNTISLWSFSWTFQSTVSLITMYHSLWHLNLLSSCIVSKYCIYIHSNYLFLYFSCNSSIFSQSHCPNKIIVQLHAQEKLIYSMLCNDTLYNLTSRNITLSTLFSLSSHFIWIVFILWKPVNASDFEGVTTCRKEYLTLSMLVLRKKKKVTVICLEASFLPVLYL